jgi:hypothetical protein
MMSLVNSGKIKGQLARDIEKLCVAADLYEKAKTDAKRTA